MRRVIGTVPDWMRCIMCYTSARNGVINHTRTCASYVRPNVVTSTRVRIGDLLGGKSR
jgi:hypothetical protein